MKPDNEMTWEEMYHELAKKYSSKEYTLHTRTREEQDLRGELREMREQQANAYAASKDLIPIKVPDGFVIQLSVDDIKQIVLGYDDLGNVIEGIDKIRECERSLAYAHAMWNMYERLYYSVKHEVESCKNTPKEEELVKLLSEADDSNYELSMNNAELSDRIKAQAETINSLEEQLKVWRKNK